MLGWNASVDPGAEGKPVGRVVLRGVVSSSFSVDWCFGMVFGLNGYGQATVGRLLWMRIGERFWVWRGIEITNQYNIGYRVQESSGPNLPLKLPRHGRLCQL